MAAILTIAQPVRAEALSLPPGSRASQQEMFERAQYWERHGRSDLARQIREKLAEPVSSPGAAAMVGRGSGLQAQPAPDIAAGLPQDKADYWEARGRSDLADGKRRPAQMRMPATGMTGGARFEARGATVTSRTGRDTTPRVRADDVAEFLSLEKQPAAREPSGVYPDGVTRESDRHAMVNASRPSSDGSAGYFQGNSRSDPQGERSAQYWEQRGRSDLAGRIRQKMSVGDANTLSIAPPSPSQPQFSPARRALEEPVSRNPESAAGRLELAQLYRNARELATARVLIDSVLATSPDAPDALFASAQLFADQHMWRETLRALEKIAAGARTTEMYSLQKTAWAHVQIDRADELVRQGMTAKAEVLLRRVAAELAISYSPGKLAEPPALWKGRASGKR